MRPGGGGEKEPDELLSGASVIVTGYHQVQESRGHDGVWTSGYPSFEMVVRASSPPYGLNYHCATTTWPSGGNHLSISYSQGASEPCGPETQLLVVLIRLELDFYTRQAREHSNARCESGLPAAPQSSFSCLMTKLAPVDRAWQPRAPLHGFLCKMGQVRTARLNRPSPTCRSR